MRAEKQHQTLHRLLTLILMLLMFVFVQAQESSTTIELNNGEKISGTILEAIPDQYVKIELADKTVRTVQAADIKSITTSIEKKKKESKVKLSVIGGINAGYDFVTPHAYIALQPRVVIGLRAKSVRIGLGAGYLMGIATKTQQPKSESEATLDVPYLHLLPVFLNVHSSFTQKKIKPTLDFSLGYPVSVYKSKLQDYTTYSWLNANSYSVSQNSATISTTGMLYAALGVGIDIKVTEKLHINPAINYNFSWYKERLKGSQLTEYIDQYPSNYTFYTDLDQKTNRFLNSLGLSINFIY